MGIVERIQEIEREIARTQKNKATEHHLGILKAKLAKFRQELLEPATKGGAKGEGFDVMKSGDARVALIGFPSVGKSTLLSTMTKTESATASYEFTTLTCIPGVIEHEGASIQLLDLPGIIEGASQGKGRGRQVIAVAKTADLILMMLDATKGGTQKGLLESELESVGIRLNKKPPNLYFKRKATGGVKFTHTVPLKQCHEKLIMSILHEYKIFNADVVFREDCSVDEFIDVIQGNRVYLKCLYVYNKIDQLTIEEVDRLARLPHTVVISCELNLNLDYLLEVIWEYLALIRIYTKKPGNPPDLGPADGIILRGNATVEHACHALHRTLAAQFRYAIVWGTSTKFSPQRVGIHHPLHHEDVVQIYRDERNRVKNFLKLDDDFYISPEKVEDVLPKKDNEDKNRQDWGSFAMDTFTNRQQVHRMGAVKFLNDDTWYKRTSKLSTYTLPDRKIPGLYLEAIDASDTELMFEGFDNLYDLEMLRMLSLANSKRINDWVLSRIGGIFPDSLEFLDLSNCKRISAKGLAGLRSLKKLKYLRLEGLDKTPNIAKSALLLEEAIPGLVVVGLDYDGALKKMDEENKLLSHDHVLIDAKGNAFVEDNNGRFFYVLGNVNERAVVDDNDHPVVHSTIRREIPALDDETFEELDNLSKGKLRHFLLGSPSGHSWTQLSERIMTYDEQWKHFDRIPVDTKMLPRYKRLPVLEAKQKELEALRSAQEVAASEETRKLEKA
ncbi:TGS domain-containing protein [Ditylenchus destructor]|nr:TGS domain-containing protein [Ditylenchus destructor]